MNFRDRKSKSNKKVDLSALSFLLDSLRYEERKVNFEMYLSDFMDKTLHFADLPPGSKERFSVFNMWTERNRDRTAKHTNG